MVHWKTVDAVVLRTQIVRGYNWFQTKNIKHDRQQDNLKRDIRKKEKYNLKLQKNREEKKSSQKNTLIHQTNLFRWWPQIVKKLHKDPKNLERALWWMESQFDKYAVTNQRVIMNMQNTMLRESGSLKSLILIENKPWLRLCQFTPMSKFEARMRKKEDLEETKVGFKILDLLQRRTGNARSGSPQVARYTREYLVAKRKRVFIPLLK